MPRIPAALLALRASTMDSRPTTRQTHQNDLTLADTRSLRLSPTLVGSPSAAVAPDAVISSVSAAATTALSSRFPIAMLILLEPHLGYLGLDVLESLLEAGEPGEDLLHVGASDYEVAQELGGVREPRLPSPGDQRVVLILRKTRPGHPRPSHHSWPQGSPDV